MAALMSWAQFASAKQMCNVAQTLITKSASKIAPMCGNDVEAEAEDDIFFLRGPIEEEIHHPTAFLYKPNLKVLMIISFPRLNHLYAQVSIFEQIKPPCYS